MMKYNTPDIEIFFVRVDDIVRTSQDLIIGGETDLDSGSGGDMGL